MMLHSPGQSPPPTVDSEQMTPAWREVKKIIDKVHLGLDEYELPAGERIGDDDLLLRDIDATTRREMLQRHNKTLIGLVDAHSAHSKQGSTIMEGIDSFLVAASKDLEREDDDELRGGPPPVREAAEELLRKQAAMGEKLRQQHDKITKHVEELERERAKGEAASRRADDLDDRIRGLGEQLGRAEAALREQRAKHEQAFHASRMQLEMIARQRDDARDEAATLRTTVRKAKAAEKKRDEERMEPLQKEIKRLNEAALQRDALTKKLEGELAAAQAAARRAASAPAATAAPSSSSPATVLERIQEASPTREDPARAAVETAEAEVQTDAVDAAGERGRSRSRRPTSKR